MESAGKNKIIIYGSYGYTGQLITELAAESGLPVILSGRNEEKLRRQADETGLTYLAANLSNQKEMDTLLNDALTVLHCAGPFRFTWREMLDACIRNNVHYLDITGEIEVFEGIKARDTELKETGIMAMPGVGFDVVPTDCLALHLKKQLPDAVKLELAFMSLRGGISHGTAQSIAGKLGEGGAVRREGKIKRVPAAYLTRTVDFGKGEKTAASIPWGDVSTAHFTTGIPDITVYTAMKKKQIRLLKLTNWLSPLLRTSFVRNRIKNWITKNIDGPDKEAREKGKSLIWGRAENKMGESSEARLETSEGYKLTAEASWLIINKVVNGEIKPGYQTPAAVYGEGLVLEIKQSENQQGFTKPS